MQLNDTHPTMAVPELMRILLDDSKSAGDFKKLCAASGAEVLDRIELFPLKRHADLLHRHIGLCIKIRNLADAAFGSSKDRLSRHQPNPAKGAVEFHEHVRFVKRMAQCFHAEARSLVIHVAGS